MWRACWRLLRAAVHVGRGLWICARHFPRLDPAARREHVRDWSLRLLALLGIGLHSRGEPQGGPVMIVANHVSWLDIVALNAVHPARFVSKAEVRGWPVVGWLVAQAGTLFLERHRRRDALRVVHQVSMALGHGDVVAVFPEGTTSEGHGVLPFHANILQAAIGAGVAVQPVALRYRDPRHPVSPAAAYVGETTLLASLWRVVRAQGLVVELDWLAPVDPQTQSRRDLADRLRRAIAAQLPSRATLPGESTGLAGSG